MCKKIIFTALLAMVTIQASQAQAEASSNEGTPSSTAKILQTPSVRMPELDTAGFEISDTIKQEIYTGFKETAQKVGITIADSGMPISCKMVDFHERSAACRISGLCLTLDEMMFDNVFDGESKRFGQASFGRFYDIHDVAIRYGKALATFVAHKQGLIVPVKAAFDSADSSSAM